MEAGDEIPFVPLDDYMVQYYLKAAERSPPEMEFDNEKLENQWMLDYSSRVRYIFLCNICALLSRDFLFLAANSCQLLKHVFDC